MAVYLGNQTVEQMEKRLSIQLSEEDKEALNSIRSEDAKVEKGTWHCFDIPFMIMAGDIETARKVVGILSKYQDQMKGEFQIGYQ